MHASLPYDPTSPAFIHNPYPVYANLRNSMPLYWYEEGKYWLATSYDIVREILNSDKFGRYYEARPNYAVYRQLVEQNPILQMKHNWLLYHNKPAHAPLKKVFASALSPVSVRNLEPFIAETARHLLSTLDLGKPFDFVAVFAYPLTVSVICKVLGLQVDIHGRLSELASKIVRTQDPIILTQNVLSEANDAAIELRSYFRQAILSRDFSDDGLIAKLLAAQENLESLNLDKVVDNCVFVVVAGHETTMNFLSMALILLENNTQLRETLSQRPDTWKPTVEELLRYESSAQTIGRTAIERTTIGTFVIEKGQEVQLALGAANRDPVHFRDPDKLDIDRPAHQNLSFSSGEHYCAGAGLARLESEIALRMFLELFRDFRIVGVERRNTVTVRGMKAVWVSR